MTIFSEDWELAKNDLESDGHENSRGSGWSNLETLPKITKGERLIIITLTLPPFFVKAGQRFFWRAKNIFTDSLTSFMLNAD
ncbi:MAG: hypothetical protein Q7T57_01630 [Dehalococcoidales bacterium]|nr:hypothetical protein [Dehalococcoidales bacterium]